MVARLLPTVTRWQSSINMLRSREYTRKQSWGLEAPGLKTSRHQRTLTIMFSVRIGWELNQVLNVAVGNRRGRPCAPQEQRAGNNDAIQDWIQIGPWECCR